MSSFSTQLLQEAKLVSLPDVYVRLKAVLDDPDSNLADVADVVGSDPAMTARLLRLVNSAYFGLATEIDTVSRAVSLLGTQEVHDLVLGVSVAQTFDGMSNEVMDVYEFWRRSVACAITSRALAEVCNVLDSERLFVTGLLHDIGHLLMYQFAPKEAQQAIELAATQDIPLHRAERTLLGVDYAQIGAELMRRWRLPQSLREPIECHLEPERSKDYELFTCVLHIGTLLSDAAAHGKPLPQALDRVSPLAWEITGLSREQCLQIAARQEPQAAAVMRLIFPGVQAASA